MSKLQIIGLDRNLLIRYHAVMDEVNLKKICHIGPLLYSRFHYCRGIGTSDHLIIGNRPHGRPFFKYLRADLDDPNNPGNDRVIFSKGHASPFFMHSTQLRGKLLKQN